MPKVRSKSWSDTPDPDDYTAASDHLSLLLPSDSAQSAVQRLRNSPMVIRRAKVLLRASRLSDLSAENPTVARRLKDLKRGELLSPVLCLRGDLHAGAELTIADGYHRICASSLLEEGADIPCRLAELPRPEETLAAAASAHPQHSD